MTETSPTFSVIVPTSGRTTLVRSLTSVVLQLEDGDEVLVVRSDANDWGGSARNSAIERARGSHLIFLDDDDVYVPDALRSMREFAVEHPGRIGVFRMRHELHPLYGYGELRWADPQLRWGNVGSPMLVVPNLVGRVGRWDPNVHSGDWSFVEETVALQGEPIFCDRVVARIRPVDRWLLPWAMLRPRLKRLLRRRDGAHRGHISTEHSRGSD